MKISHIFYNCSLLEAAKKMVAIIKLLGLEKVGEGEEVKYVDDRGAEHFFDLSEIITTSKEEEDEQGS